MISYFKKMVNARTIDTIFRGVSRGMAAKTFVGVLGKLFQSDTTTAATITSVPVFLATTYTSYAGTRWWTTNPKELATYRASNRSSFFQKSQKLGDAFFRGVSRAEATTNCLILIGTLLNCDLLVPAVALGLATLILTAWSSYQRTSINRDQYAIAALPSYNKPSLELEEYAYLPLLNK